MNSVVVIAKPIWGHANGVIIFESYNFHLWLATQVIQFISIYLYAFASAHEIKINRYKQSYNLCLYKTNKSFDSKIKDWFDETITDNDQQQTAIRNILRGSSKPYPYIIFGPPGTGKTVTVVEAMRQVKTLHAEMCHKIYAFKFNTFPLCTTKIIRISLLFFFVEVNLH